MSDSAATPRNGSGAAVGGVVVGFFRKAPSAAFKITLPALPFALSIDRILNGISRSFFGWGSDRIGRENTMFIAFALEGVSILLLSQFGVALHRERNGGATRAAQQQTRRVGRWVAQCAPRRDLCGRHIQMKE